MAIFRTVCDIFRTLPLPRDYSGGWFGLVCVCVCCVCVCLVACVCVCLVACVGVVLCV